MKACLYATRQQGTLYAQNLGLNTRIVRIYSLSKIVSSAGMAGTSLASATKELQIYCFLLQAEGTNAEEQWWKCCG